MVQSDCPVAPPTISQTAVSSSQENAASLAAAPLSEAALAGAPHTSLAPVRADDRAIIFEEPKVGRLYLLLKRLLDILVAVSMLVLLSPLLALIALAILIDNPGPILFSQMRVGRNNRAFRFYKFRSMVKNAPALQAQLKAENEAAGPIFKMRRDPRVTRVGRILRKYSLDELPQLVNVLRGEMSLVGPRPHLPSEVAQYEAHQHRRLTVQPGLVCLREIHGRSELTFERWIELDLQYIACRSLRTDLGILIKLVPAVLCGRGAY